MSISFPKFLVFRPKSSIFTSMILDPQIFQILDPRIFEIFVFLVFTHKGPRDRAWWVIDSVLLRSADNGFLACLGDSPPDMAQIIGSCSRREHSSAGIGS